MNCLIRQYFPKGTSFENIKNEEVQRDRDILNNRPRKKFNFLTQMNFYYEICLIKKLSRFYIGMT